MVQSGRRNQLGEGVQRFPMVACDTLRFVGNHDGPASVFGHFEKDQHLAHSGFLNVAEALQREAAAFARPVLLIYGDSPNFRIHTPFRKRAPQLLGLEVFGADQMHAVEITVDTDDLGVSSYRPIWNRSQ